MRLRQLVVRGLCFSQWRLQFRTVRRAGKTEENFLFRIHRFRDLFALDGASYTFR